MRPLIGITMDMDGERCFIRPGYALAVERAGGVPVLLPPAVNLVEEYVARCDGFIFSGGDDPIMEQWGIATHPKATKVHPERQAFEVALLHALEMKQEKPILGVCLGMQLMSLHAGGSLEQHLPDLGNGAAEAHWGRKEHAVAGDVGRGRVLSHHRQAITNSGRLRVCGRAPDGLIEAVQDDARPFYLGVQWHPERTDDENLGVGLFRRLIEAARQSS
jgi:putative glutamine amidotransferase